MTTIRNIEESVSVNENEQMAGYEVRPRPEIRERNAMENASMGKNVGLALQVVEFLRANDLSHRGYDIGTFTLDGLADVLCMDHDMMRKVLAWLEDAGFVRRVPFYMLFTGEVPTFRVTEDGKTWSYVMIGMSIANPVKRLAARISRLVDDRRNAKIRKRRVLWSYNIARDI
jgi:hypothetical protein